MAPTSLSSYLFLSAPPPSESNLLSPSHALLLDRSLVPLGLALCDRSGRHHWLPRDRGRPVLGRLLQPLGPAILAGRRRGGLLQGGWVTGRGWLVRWGCVGMSLLYSQHIFVDISASRCFSGGIVVNDSNAYTKVMCLIHIIL